MSDLVPVNLDLISPSRDFFSSIDPSKIRVNSKAFLGFLAAAERLGGDDIVCISKTDKGLFVERCGRIWSVAVMTSAGPNFQATFMPLSRVKNAARWSFNNGDVTEIEVLKNAVGVGGRWIKILPPQLTRPVLKDWDVRALMSPNQIRLICDHVLLARSKNPKMIGLTGVFLDFEYDGKRADLFAVATDGKRMHMHRFPNINIHTKRHPPELVVPPDFFRYLSVVAAGEWTALEIGDGQVTARGDDYMVIASPQLKGKAFADVRDWRKIDVIHSGHWLIKKKYLVGLLLDAGRCSDNGEVSVYIDVVEEKIEIMARLDGGEFSEGNTLKISRRGGPHVNGVRFDVQEFLDAIRPCSEGKLELGFDSNLKKQKETPMTIVCGDFKATISPVRKN